jgi:hypothetical protein
MSGHLHNFADGENMTYENLADAEQKSMRHLARAVLDQLASGRSAEDIVREMHANGWTPDEAREFVQKMSDEAAKSAQPLNVRFPDMTPVRRQPSLFTINGCGTGLYGARDKDPETGTYVKTFCACFIFVPIFGLSAYRVAQAQDSSWYLLGKVPLSRFVKVWNCLVVTSILAVIGLIYWNNYTGSADYLARKDLREAEQALADGDVARAARLYTKVAQKGTPATPEARQKLLELCDSPALTTLSPDKAIDLFAQMNAIGGWGENAQRIYRAGAAWIPKIQESDPAGSIKLLDVLWQLSPAESEQQLTTLLSGPLQQVSGETVCDVWSAALALQLTPDQRRSVVERGLDWITAHRAADPANALALADQLSTALDPPLDTLLSIRRELLEQAVTANPTDVSLTVRLALLLEQESDLPRIKSLLEPLRPQLGATDGARLLGQILASEGDLDAAYELLTAYLTPRLAALHEADARFKTAIEQAQDSAIQLLKQGSAAGFNYSQYESLTSEAQQAMVDEYLVTRIREDAGVIAARESLIEHSTIAHPAIDLGIVTLRRAQGMADATTRQTELEKAERTFLAVQGLAGDDATYQLHLGQVYYWLGKPDEGKQIFDQLLITTNRDFSSLMAICRVLREIGDFRQARAYGEEAYGKATDDNERYHAAHMRAITSASQADEIIWLERSNPADSSVQADLCSARGHVAENDGKLDEAAAQYRQAIATYDKMHETPSSLNNSGLICVSLYGVTGDRASLDEGIRRLEKGMAMSPNDALLMANNANTLIQITIRDLAAVGAASAGAFTDFDALDFCVANDAELTQLRDKARGMTSLQKALSYFDRTAVMSPRSINAYSQLLQANEFLADAAALSTLASRLKDAQFDQTDLYSRTVAYYRFEEDPEDRARFTSGLDEARKAVTKWREQGQHAAMALEVSQVVRYAASQSDIAQLDTNELVQLAEEAHAAAPSLGTYSTLIYALLVRANQSLSQAHPDYAEAARAASRSLTPALCVPLALPLQSELGAAARQNADVLRAVALTKERHERFATTGLVSGWALLHGMGDPAAESWAALVQADQVSTLSRECGLSLAPYAAANACYEYWARLATGRADSARDPFQPVIAAGIPLPALLLDIQAEASPPAEQEPQN